MHNPLPAVFQWRGKRVPTPLYPSRVLDFAWSDPAAQMPETSTGPWQMSTRTNIRGLTRVDCVTLDGDDLFLAGVHETVQMSTGNRPGRLFQTLVVLRASLTDLSLREVVWLEQQERSSVVHQIVAGGDLVALLVDAGTVLVFRLDEAQTSAREDFRDTFPGATSIAWVDGEHVLVVSEGGERVVQVFSR